VVLAATFAPAVALAGITNHDVEQAIAQHLKESGRLKHYRVVVKYVDGTVWLKGQVCSPEQARIALNLAGEAECVERVVNNLTIVAAVVAPPAPVKDPPQPQSNVPNPLRKELATNSQEDQGAARRVPASFTPAVAQRVAATEPVEEVPQPLPAAPSPARPAQRPIPAAMMQSMPASNGVPGAPLPMANPGMGGGVAPAQYDQPNMPNYAWPSYASYPNYAAVTYPRQYSANAWPYIGPFYPYPQVPLGWRKVSLQWDDGWWFLDFSDKPGCCWWR
jgi:hypothetical protein